MKPFFAKADLSNEKSVHEMTEEELFTKMSALKLKRDQMTETLEEIAVRLFQIKGERMGDPNYVESLPPIEDQVMAVVVEKEDGEVDVLLNRAMDRQDVIEKLSKEHPGYKPMTIITQAEVKFFANLFEQYKHTSSVIED
jgi:hypothetical protein